MKGSGRIIFPGVLLAKYILGRGWGGGRSSFSIWYQRLSMAEDRWIRMLNRTDALRCYRESSFSGSRALLMHSGSNWSPDLGLGRNFHVSLDWQQAWVLPLQHGAWITYWDHLGTLHLAPCHWKVLRHQWQFTQPCSHCVTEQIHFLKTEMF